MLCLRTGVRNATISIIPSLSKTNILCGILVLRGTRSSLIQSVKLLAFGTNPRGGPMYAGSFSYARLGLNFVSRLNGALCRSDMHFRPPRRLVYFWRLISSNANRGTILVKIGYSVSHHLHLWLPTILDWELARIPPE